MRGGHDDPPVPLVARQQHELAEESVRSGGDGEVDAIGPRHLRNLLRRALVQMELHVRVTRAELPNHRGQHVPRLRVSGADGERAPLLVLVFGGHALDVLRLAQDAQGVIDDPLARRRDPGQRAPVAREDVESELVLQQPQLLADRRLRRAQLEAAAVMLSSLWATAARKRNCCSFMSRDASGAASSVVQTGRM